VSHFEADHRRRLDESVALLAEMLPRVDEEVEEIRAEYRDGWLCGDHGLIERTDAEVDLRMHVHARLEGLWMLMLASQDSRDEALSRATAEEIQATEAQEFRRRPGLRTTSSRRGVFYPGSPNQPTLDTLLTNSCTTLTPPHTTLRKG